MASLLDTTLQLRPLTQPLVGGGALPFDRTLVSSVAARAYARIATAWKLPNATAAALINVSPRTWGRIKAEAWNGALDQDQLMRVSAITGLYKALHLYFGESLADKWVRLANQGSSFGGHKPIHLMLQGGLPAIMDIRDYVDALRGGV